MIGAAFCGVDPSYVCASGGGSWWPLLIGVAVLAVFGWRRLRRHGWRRCPVCGSLPARSCAPGCYNDWPVES